ncbi:hypothetical protein AAON49_04560 [Pseudotenacibaculum sp. MALMAid0570]|mgnify:CR=1 FL=1|uniref:hypothetical protein n=1 Tax=Pseudotenacibaculum sp. MALMAid0570 TaxID=3143938 RepID=UPI0032DF48AF
MKQFLSYILVTVFMTALVLEVVLRVFQLSSHAVPSEIINNNYVNKPYAEAIWVKGGLGEIKAHYKINPQGYNSLKDYSKISKDKYRIAIMGDSYIEGLQVNVENSIGRILEKQMNDRVEVHEYGVSGANIIDYGLLYQKYIKDNYDIVFIHLKDDDLLQDLAGNVGRVDKKIKITRARKIYNNYYTARYLNINHGVGEKLSKIIKGETFSKRGDNVSSKRVNDRIENSINRKALTMLDSSVVILYEKGKLTPFLFEKFSFEKAKIKHDALPKDFGFDIHWNFNGRVNCAKTIEKYLLERQKNLKQ